MSSSHVRVPPDSTGKKIASENRIEVEYDTRVGSLQFSKNDVVTQTPSGATGTVTAIDRVDEIVTTGEIYLKDVTGTFVNNEVLQVSAVTIATANIPSGAPDIETQHNIIVDPDNPNFKQKIDATGATVNTFSEGSPQFDAFGSLRTNDVTRIVHYKHDEENIGNDFYTDVATGGTVTHNRTEAAAILAVTNQSGSKSIRTTHRYHRYYPGYGTLIEFTMGCGDSGKSGNQRSWGLYDDDNGVFFRLNGTTMEVVLRSSTSGSPVDTTVVQSDWNKDKADGTGTIGFILNVSKVNLYWIDVQWLGAGRIRFGSYAEEGERIIFHTWENSNLNNIAYMQTATLPLRFENINTSGTSGSSELRQQCAAIKVEGAINPFFANQSGAVREEFVLNEREIISATVANGGSGYTNGSQTLTINSGTSSDSVLGQVQVTVSSNVVQSVDSIVYAGRYTTDPNAPTATAGGGGTGATLNLTMRGILEPLSAIRSTALDGDGYINRRQIIPLSVSVYVVDGPALIQVVEDTTLVGSTWPTTVGTADISIDATRMSGGKTVTSLIAENGTHEVDLRPVYDLTSDTLRVDADGTQNQNVVIAARGVGTATPTVSVSMDWSEV